MTPTALMKFISMASMSSEKAKEKEKGTAMPIKYKRMKEKHKEAKATMLIQFLEMGHLWLDHTRPDPELKLGLMGYFQCHERKDASVALLGQA